MNRWLDMLRSQYNWLLAERFDWWELNRCPVNACPLTSSIAPPKEQPDYYSQKRSLVTLKKERSGYKEIHSQVLQDMVKRVGLAFDRYLKGDSKGKRSGKPRFKGKGRYHSFTYTQADNDWIVGNLVNLPKLGSIKLIQHRPLPEGFDVKTACISKKADGWYITFSLLDESVPTINPDIDVKKGVGIDLGLKDFLVTGDGLHVPIPQYYRKAEKRLAKEERKLARKKNKASKRRAKRVCKVAKLHAKVANQRKDFHHKTAVLLLRKYEVIAHENLNIKGLARTHLAKSVHDAGWGTFITILANKAEKAGCLTIGVNPSGTTQMCSDCDAHVAKTLSDRRHCCPHCGLELDRDENSGRNMWKRAEGHPVLKARGVRSTSWTVKREAHPIPLCG
ncbi:RNA-guided endonuclease InsQ/TnpB family protein [Gloeobacter kilaueensis]|uniref:RNA-guided endonuclease InsQ/TnpB family protein n=1 Tax=Gloeobacter kilaueensis TaxID=1416614 RepID=UPI001FE2014E|nr:transposase [Gloeobacter kilaueensis]